MEKFTPSDETSYEELYGTIPATSGAEGNPFVGNNSREIGIEAWKVDSGQTTVSGIADSPESPHTFPDYDE